MVVLETTDQVFDALGGTAGVAALVCSKRSAVANWKAFGFFPANTYGVLIDALNEQGLTASRSLWRMRERSEAAS